jgi:acetylcholinesterase
VADTECTGSTDLIACLRTVPFDKLMTAVNKSPNAFSFTSVRHGWQPSVDGQIIVRNPQESLQKGLYAKARFQVWFFFPFFAC